MTAISPQDAKLLSVLFDKAVLGASNTSVGKVGSSGKAFEIYALAVLLRYLRIRGYSISCVNGGSATLVFPGGPSLPKTGTHSYFVATKGSEVLQVWLSIETLTQSHVLAGTAPPSRASFHELDISIFDSPLSDGQRPPFSNLVFAATCKYSNASKAHLREALGFRRETAMFTGSLLPSRAPWFVGGLAADPAVPIVLFSRDLAIGNYARPIDVYGLYVRRLKYVV